MPFCLSPCKDSSWAEKRNKERERVRQGMEALEKAGEMFSPEWEELRKIDEKLHNRESYSLWPASARAAEIDIFKAKLGVVWDERTKYVKQALQVVQPLMVTIYSELKVMV